MRYCCRTHYFDSALHRSLAHRAAETLPCRLRRVLPTVVTLFAHQTGLSIVATVPWRVLSAAAAAVEPVAALVEVDVLAVLAAGQEFAG